ncbi:MAG: LamG domain-containing protein [Candidatus Hodarchaeota archaeon]
MRGSKFTIVNPWILICLLFLGCFLGSGILSNGSNKIFLGSDNSIQATSDNLRGSEGYNTNFEPLSDLVLSLSMNEGTGSITYDQVGYGNNGLISGALWTTGFSGNALEFDGVDDYVEVPAPMELDKGQITVSAWVFFYSAPTPDAGFQYVIVCQDDDNGRVFQLTTWDGYFNWHRFGEGDEVLGTTLIEAYRWYHVAASFDGETHRLYVNGVLEDQKSGSLSSSTTVPIHIGKKGNDDDWSYFNGSIDEVQIFSKALSAEGIFELYERSGFNDLALHLPMNEGTGDLTYDQSGSGNNGINNGALWTRGVTGTAFEFDGIDDYVEVPAIDLITGQITVSAWVYLNTAPPSGSDFEYVIVCQDNNDGRVFQLTTLDGKFDWHLVGFGNVLGSDLIEAQRWYNVVATFDGSTHKLYVDGILNSQQIGNLSTSDTIPIHIGKKGTDDDWSYFDGIIDEVRIYTKALNVADILGLYQSYSPQEPLTTTESETTTTESKTTSTEPETVTTSEGPRSTPPPPQPVSGFHYLIVIVVLLGFTLVIRNRKIT